MSKYLVLVILNMPFVFFGVYRAAFSYHKKTLSRVGLFLRLAFWGLIALGLIFAKSLYDVLRSNDLTNSPPLSLADVILVTGVIFCLFLNMRLYSKLEVTQRRLVELNEQLAIRFSKHKHK